MKESETAQANATDVHNEEKYNNFTICEDESSKDENSPYQYELSAFTILRIFRY